jgi:hypothetical protein
LPYPAPRMATTGGAAEGFKWSRRLPPGPIPRRPSAGASFDSRTRKAGPAGIDFHSWTGMAGWLPIMSRPRMETGDR